MYFVAFAQQAVEFRRARTGEGEPSASNLINGARYAMNETIAVGCRYCGWMTFRDRVKLERDRLVACGSCRSLVSSREAEAVGKEIETRLSLIGAGGMESGSG
jgi:hypothetical protein